MQLTGRGQVFCGATAKRWPDKIRTRCFARAQQGPAPVHPPASKPGTGQQANFDIGDLGLEQLCRFPHTNTTTGKRLTSPYLRPRTRRTKRDSSTAPKDQIATTTTRCVSLLSSFSRWRTLCRHSLVAASSTRCSRAEAEASNTTSRLRTCRAIRQSTGHNTHARIATDTSVQILWVGDPPSFCPDAPPRFPAPDLGPQLTSSTIACVHYPHHCPCAWPSHEDKFELADGQRICISRGGFKTGEAARKVELARKGLL